MLASLTLNGTAMEGLSFPVDLSNRLEVRFQPAPYGEVSFSPGSDRLDITLHRTDPRACYGVITLSRPGGQLLSARVEALSSSRQQLSWATGQQDLNACRWKIFFLDRTLRPLCPPSGP